LKLAPAEIAAAMIMAASQNHRVARRYRRDMAFAPSNRALQAA
jgi:hypothetical protein